MATKTAKGRFVVVVRGYNGIDDAQTWSKHRTLKGAMDRIAKEKKSNSAASYNARWSIEDSSGKKVCSGDSCGI